MMRLLRRLLNRRRWDEPAWLDEWERRKKRVYETTYALMEGKDGH